MVEQAKAENLRCMGKKPALVALLRRRVSSGLYMLAFIALTTLGSNAEAGAAGLFSAGDTVSTLVIVTVAAAFSHTGNDTNDLKNLKGSFSDCRMFIPPLPLSGASPKFGSKSNPASTGGSSDIVTLYGTFEAGGSLEYGTVFAVQSDGTGFTVLHNFSGEGDGNTPAAGLVLYGTNLIGTTINGGSTGNGVVYAVATNGTGFSVLHNFSSRQSYGYTNSDGGNPYCQLIISGDTVYGTASVGGSANSGTVFALNLTSTNFTVLHSFTATQPDSNYNLTNSDGATPFADLILSGDTLYGTASGGGTNGAGTVFAVKTNGTGFRVVHTFAPINLFTDTNSDGIYPSAGLILFGDTLYGTAFRGGNANSGTVFAVNTNGTVFTNLHNFTGGSDGFGPAGDLLLFSNVLIGTSSGNSSGGSGGNGTIFGLNTDGSGFAVIHSFSAESYDAYFDETNSDGANPQGGLIAYNGTLYGTTRNGTPGANGGVFSLSLVPGPVLFDANLSGTNLILDCANSLSHKTNVTLMSSNPTLPLNQWTPVATNILTTDENFTVTNAVDPKTAQGFYILRGQ